MISRFLDIVTVILRALSAQAGSLPVRVREGRRGGEGKGVPATALMSLSCAFCVNLATSLAGGAPCVLRSAGSSQTFSVLSALCQEEEKEMHRGRSTEVSYGVPRRL